jgi:hypothetical protein
MSTTRQLRIPGISLSRTSKYSEKRKSALIDQEIPDEIGFLERMMAILDSISDEELHVFFHSWIERIKMSWIQIVTMCPGQHLDENDCISRQLPDG